LSKADFSSRNARVSLIGLIALGLGACAAIVYNIDNWLAGGAAVKRVAETCNVLGSGCSNAVTSIFKIIGSPQLILLTVAVAALIAAAIKAVFVVASARKVAQRYFHTAEEFPRLGAILGNLDATRVRVRVADDSAISAFTYGVIKPTICLSSGLIRSLNDSELAALVAHEVGHIKRRDNLAIFLALFIRDFLWPLPISHQLFAIFVSEKEFAADDFAVRMTGDPVELAGAIVSVAKAVHSKKALSPAYATFFSNKATAKTRIHRLLQSGDTVRTSVLRLITGALISVLILASVVGLAYAQPSLNGGAYGKCKMDGACIKHNYSCCSSSNSGSNSNPNSRSRSIIRFNNRPNNRSNNTATTSNATAISIK